jgi:N-formylglutamate deformylase
MVTRSCAMRPPLAVCRGYLREPPGEVTASNWPCAWDEEFAAPMRAVLERILTACVGFASEAKA